MVSGPRAVSTNGLYSNSMGNEETAVLPNFVIYAVSHVEKLLLRMQIFRVLRH